MRILVISDIHANLTAFEAVLTDAKKFDAVWCLGDLVGYGPEPNACVNLLRSLPNPICILGNHDAAVAGKIALDAFNNEARSSVLWMQDNLSKDNLEYIKNLPPKLELYDVTLSHGSPRNPVWEYVLELPVAKLNFDYFKSTFCFVGHSHIPISFTATNPDSKLLWKLFQDNESLELTQRSIINPGSVGQPRDRDVRASYGIFLTDDLIWENHRVEYEVTIVQEKIISSGLPARNAIRLSEGW